MWTVVLHCPLSLLSIINSTLRPGFGKENASSTHTPCTLLSVQILQRTSPQALVVASPNILRIADKAIETRLASPNSRNMSRETLHLNSAKDGVL